MITTLAWLETVLRAESAKYAEHMDAGDLFEASRVAGRIEAFDEVRCMIRRGYVLCFPDEVDE